MPIEIISAKDVLALGRANREKSYPALGRDEHRLRPFPQVASRTSFRFETDAKIFTAGSCFARNIERSLRKMDYNIISSSDEFYNPFPERHAFQRFNKYTIHSILNEMEWALGERSMNSAELMCPTKDGLYCDTQTSGDSLAAPLDEMVHFRKTFNTTFAKVADADVVILTLGLAECWRDDVTGEYLNRFPGATAIKNNPDRFSLHVLDHDDIYDGLARTHRLIEKYNSNFKMLVTVSPVPLDRTFRPQDILAANCYSKSVQRAAVEKFVKDYPADYFASYETVTLSDMSYAWSDHDFRHVRREMVDILMGRVLEQYTQVTERQSAQKTRGLMTAYMAAGDPSRARIALDVHIADFDLPLDLMQISAELCLSEGQPEQAAAILQTLIAEITADQAFAEEILERRPAVVLQSANQLLEHCERLQGEDNISTLQMDKLRARKMVTDLIKASPENADLAWLKEYLDRSQQAEKVETQQSQKHMLIEAAALARLRALDESEVEAAQAIVEEALQTLVTSEALTWELAIKLRKAERLDEALDHFVWIGQRGGPKAVQAVKFALPLARRLKKHILFADLADDVAKNLQ